MAHDHDEDDAHDHGHEGHDHAPVSFERTLVDDETLRTLDALFPPLAEHLSLTAKYRELTRAEREDATSLHERVEKERPFQVGFHAEGDTCAVCGEPTLALFQDEFKGGARLAWAAFLHDLPVHAACAPDFDKKFPRLAPRVLDQARRNLVQDTSRPPADVALFWRHDAVRHGTFGLEDWANAVYGENEDTMDKRMVRGIEKLLQYVHGRLYHHH